MAEWLVTVTCIAEGAAVVEAPTSADARAQIAAVATEGPAAIQRFLRTHQVDLAGDATFMQVADVEPAGEEL